MEDGEIVKSEKTDYYEYSELQELLEIARKRNRPLALKATGDFDL